MTNDGILETNRQLERARQAVREMMVERDQLRRERNAVAEARGEAWIWSDTDPNDLESMSDDMIVRMRAGQLRELLAAERSWDCVECKQEPNAIGPGCGCAHTPCIHDNNGLRVEIEELGKEVEHYKRGVANWMAKAKGVGRGCGGCVGCGDDSLINSNACVGSGWIAPREILEKIGVRLDTRFDPDKPPHLRDNPVPAHPAFINQVAKLVAKLVFNRLAEICDTAEKGAPVPWRWPLTRLAEMLKREIKEKGGGPG